MILALNLLLELAALVLTWPTKLRWLRGYLFYLLTADVLVRVLVARTSHGYAPWYIYWAGRSLGLVLQALLLHENLRPREPGLKWYRELWTFGPIGLLLVWLVVGWTNLQPNGQYMREMMVGGVLLLATPLFASRLSPKDRVVLAGSVAWVTIIFLTSLRPGWLHWYAPASLVPLFIWVCCPAIGMKVRMEEADDERAREVDSRRDGAQLLSTAGGPA